MTDLATWQVHKTNVPSTCRYGTVAQQWPMNKVQADISPANGTTYGRHDCCTRHSTVQSEWKSITSSACHFSYRNWRTISRYLHSPCFEPCGLYNNVANLWIFTADGHQGRNTALQCVHFGVTRYVGMLNMHTVGSSVIWHTVMFLLLFWTNNKWKWRTTEIN